MTTPSVNRFVVRGGWRLGRRAGALAGLLLALIVVSLMAAPRATAINGRQEGLRYRVPLTVNAAGIARHDATVEVAIDFATLAGPLETVGIIDTATLRLVEVGPDGQALDAAVPFQFEPAGGGAAGTLIFQLTGETAATATRHYALSFGAESGATTAAAELPAAAQVTLTNTTDEGFAAYRIATPHAIYYYHKLGGGFSGLEDDDGNDWIKWNASAGNAGDYRGIPNMVHPANGGYFHPGRTTSTSQVISEGAMKVTFESTSNNGAWKVRWEIFPDYARMTVLKAAGKYWFLYEGTPGGQLGAGDFVMRSNQKQTGALRGWASDLQGEEWAYVADPAVGRSIFLLHHTEDTTIDSYKPSSDRKMTIFGFGRNDNRRYLTQVGDQFSFGLVNSTEYNTVAQAVHAALNAASVTVGAVEQQ